MTFLAIYFTVGFVILAFNTMLWGISLVLRDSSIIDPFWSVLFLMAGGLYFLFSGEGLMARKLLLMLLVTVWALRLAVYLAWRNWGKPEDFRYQVWRKAAGPNWWWRSYFKVFLLQGFLAWIISIPLLSAQYGMASKSLGLIDLLAVFVWLVGFFFEAVGDFQLAQFKANPANKGKVLDTGVWRYTRHPNYFGEAAQWWAYYLFALVAGGFWTIYAPILMTYLLLKVSGVAMLEKSLAQAKPQYREYIQATPVFFPWFPKKQHRTHR